MGQKGEVHADQAHRGYSSAQRMRPAMRRSIPLTLYMRYTPDANGFFAGQTGYGYVSITSFLEAAAAVNSGAHGIAYYEQQGSLALASQTLAVTAILQAGRLSLDHAGAAIDILYNDHGQPQELWLAPAAAAGSGGGSS